MADHKVEPGDCFSSIAARNGFFNYLTLYNHADNAALKSKRANPNMLVENDVVRVPEKRTKKIRTAIDKEHKFVVDRNPTRLRLMLLNMDRKALKVDACKLMVGAAHSTDKPKQNGLLELEIGAAPIGGTVHTTLPAAAAVGDRPKPVAKPAPDPAKAPPHPPDLYPQDFTDLFHPPAPGPVDVEWVLKPGALEPASEVRGCLQRLSNLGYAVPIGTVENADTEAAVRVWQKSKGQAKGSGKIADIRGSLETDHDKP